jgi:hypothetical protein
MHKINYHPSVCRQTDTIHTHYNLVLLHPDKFASDIDALRILSGRIGGQTAGLVILRVEDLIRTGIDLNQYGINYLLVEPNPLYQKCHKGEDDSPSIDWDKWLFIENPVIIPTPPNPNVMVARIKH